MSIRPVKSVAQSRPTMEGGASACAAPSVSATRPISIRS